VAEIEAERSSEEARLAGLGRRVEALRIRALGSGTVITPRPEELTGRWVASGTTVMEVAEFDTVEIRITLQGAGGTLIGQGSPARLLAAATVGAPVSGVITSVSTNATARTVEARLRLPAQPGLRPGMTGRARVTVRNSNLWGALWWGVRRGIRSDILL
jgi:hypothetical protein